MKSFEERMASLDTSLFDAIDSQTTLDDKCSFLAVQKAVRAAGEGYCYLEIGSYMGGSLQPFILDPSCKKIYSIDKRPRSPEDDRGIPFVYHDNATERMMGLLKEVSPEGVQKVECFEGDASEIQLSAIQEKPNLCLIDGEHTERAVLSDFRFCESVLAPNGAIMFHDANVVFTALQKIVASLREAGRSFRAYVIPTTVFVVELDDCSFHQSSDLQRLLIDNHIPFLEGLRSMEHFREVYNMLPVRVLRAMSRRLKRVMRRNP
ncbi:MAG: class I SAM-dependent methyltransferase [Bacteroidota bacterium]